MEKKKVLLDYLGKPIKRSYYQDPTPILDKFKVPEHWLLKTIWPHSLSFPIPIGKDISVLQKWTGTKKIPFIYLARTKTGWLRLATKEEANLFLEREKHK